MTVAATFDPETAGQSRSLYAHLNAAERYIHESRDAALLALLRRNGVTRLAGLRIVELGCGSGSLLRTLLGHGADSDRLTGIDIDAARVGDAGQSAAAVSVAVASAGALPYRDESFDLAFAFTSLSSILNDNVRRATAAEALRVLRPGGLLVVYDFWINPFNRATRAISPGDLRQLFGSVPVEIERATLAPPIVRALGGRAGLCRALERLPWLRSHLLAAVRKAAA